MKTIRLVTLALLVLGAVLLGDDHRTAMADGEYGTLYIDVLPDASNTTSGHGTVDVCRGGLAVNDTFNIDIVIVGAPDVRGALYEFNYDPSVLRVTAHDWETWKFGAGVGISDSMPDTDGHFNTSWAGSVVSGDGVIQRITLQAVGNGQSDLYFTYTEGSGGSPQVSDPVATPYFPPEVLVDDPPGSVRAVVGGTCPPTPGLTPAPTPTATPTPTLTATPTPTSGPTRTLVWAPGWHNETWSGSSAPEEAFACAAGNYAAAYRFVDSGLERYFPERLDISNMNPLEQYAAFLILITGDVTCQMPIADPSGTERTLSWDVGWHNEGWTGGDGTAPEDAFACAAGNYAAAYRFVDGGLERHFPDRADISNMGPLNQYDTFLILVTASVNCSMPIAH
jgi:hypothetical protein